MCNAAVGEKKRKKKKHRWCACDEREQQIVRDRASGGAGSYATACPGRSPSRQSHFPKVAVTHGAPNPAVYVTVAVKGIMADI